MEHSHLIDSILPAREVHLLGGPSGAGKSRWLFQMLLEWEKGLPIIGFASHPVPWAYVATDRSLPSVHRTMWGMGIDPSTVNIIPAFGEHSKSIFGVMDAVEAAKAELVVIESFSSYVETPGNPHQVRKFLNMMGAETASKRHAKGLTIIGVVESPKMKPYEKYENPRQRISGCASWSHYSETVMLVEFLEASAPNNPCRVLTLCPRNHPGVVCEGQFDALGILKFIHSRFYMQEPEKKRHSK